MYIKEATMREQPIAINQNKLRGSIHSSILHVTFEALILHAVISVIISMFNVIMAPTMVFNTFILGGLCKD